jgi:hypothetical protein
MYTKHQLKEFCQNGVVTVVFTKADGSERTMKATLLPEYVNNGKTLLQESENKRPENPDVLAVWDVDAKGWRSFRIDSIKGVS